MSYLPLYEPVCIPDDENGFRFQHPAEVICIEGAGHYCNIYCTSNVQYRNVRISLKEIEAVLPDGMFFRVHRSYIVSKMHVRAINRTFTRVYCLGDITICIGETYQTDLARRFRIRK